MNVAPVRIQPNHLTLVCRKCTRKQEFPAPHIREAVAQAAAAGWRMGVNADHSAQIYTCPRCPK